MKIDFPYKHYEPIEPAEVPDENPMGVYEPRALGAGGDEQAVLRRGFEAPCGAPGCMNWSGATTGSWS